MRLSSRKRQTGALDLPMTSMIDIVFLLLIFFICTASITKAERELSAAIKVQDSASAQPADYVPAVVEVFPSGGRGMYRIGGRETRDPKELTDILRQFPHKLDGAFVKVENGLPWGDAAAAFQACRAAGFQSVTYVAVE